jgi:hypothetical protein
MTVAHKAVFDTDRKQLATLLDLAPDAERLWGDDELGALLRHQMTAPMQVDLINLERGLALKVRNLAESQGLTLKSFGDLLAHPNPPVELLKITKDFAKACRLSPHSPVPHEIASVLYFASIAAAMVRCRRRITGLTNDALAEGLRWVLSRPWLDAPTRSLVGESLLFINTHAGECT